MPTELIVVFLLFIAVLAFAWFYLQRAKARDGGTTVETAAAPEATAPSEAPAAAAPEVHEAHEAPEPPAESTTRGA